MFKTMLAAAAAALFACAPAAAQTPDAQTVSTRDLALDRPGDVAKLDRRIGRAARALCGQAPDWDVKGKNDAARCRRATVLAAAAQRDRLVDEARRLALAAAR